MFEKQLGQKAMNKRLVRKNLNVYFAYAKHQNNILQKNQDETMHNYKMKQLLKYFVDNNEIIV